MIILSKFFFAVTAILHGVAELSAPGNTRSYARLRTAGALALE